MIADAKKVLADAQIETGKENTCTFASGVVVVPKGTAVSIDVDGIVMIENCPVTINREQHLPCMLTILSWHIRQKV